MLCVLTNLESLCLFHLLQDIKIAKIVLTVLFMGPFQLQIH